MYKSYAVHNNVFSINFSLTISFQQVEGENQYKISPIKVKIVKGIPNIF